MSRRKDWILYSQRWRWYERNNLPWNKLKIAREFASRRAFARMPIHGDVLEGFAAGRLEIGEHTLLEPHCWITLNLRKAHVKIGDGCFLNIGTMIACENAVTIGDHTMFANGCFIGDANHKFDDPDVPVPWQGFTSKGPVKIGSNCWFGVNCVVLSGVTVGDHCVIAANSVVTSDIPAGTIAAGSPAKVIKEIEFAPSVKPAEQ